MQLPQQRPKSRKGAAEEEAHLAPRAADDDVLMVLGVGLHLDALAAAGRLHREVPDFGREVVANLLLLCVEAHALHAGQHEPQSLLVTPEVSLLLWYDLQPLTRQGENSKCKGSLSHPQSAQLAAPATSRGKISVQHTLPMSLPQAQNTLNGISKRMTRMPWSSFLARSRSGCCVRSCTQPHLSMLAQGYSRLGRQKVGWHTCPRTSELGGRTRQLARRHTAYTHLQRLASSGAAHLVCIIWWKVKVVGAGSRERRHPGTLSTLYSLAWVLLACPQQTESSSMKQLLNCPTDSAQASTHRADCLGIAVGRVQTLR